MAKSDEATHIALPKDRIFERTQGCWNCKHSESANKFWTVRRQQDLKRAAHLVQMFPRQGENHPQVVNIRRMVDLADHAIAMHEMVRCTNERARTAKNEPIGDLVASNFLCSQWSGAQGASIARAGQKADPLPEELVEKLDGNGPKTLQEVYQQPPSLIRRK